MKTNYKMEKDLLKNFSISGKEESLERILSTLKFIAKIREGEKIDVKTMSIVRPDFPSRAYRTFISRESRNETFEFIKTSINKAIDMVYYYLSMDRKSDRNSSDKNTKDNFHRDVAKVIITNIVEAKKGLYNLTVTYEEDRKFVTDIETVMETLEIKIGKNKLPNQQDEIGAHNTDLSQIF